LSNRQDAHIEQEKKPCAGQLGLSLIWQWQLRYQILVLLKLEKADKESFHFELSSLG